MINICRIALITLLLFTAAPFVSGDRVYALANDYTETASVDVSIIVRENNIFDVTERITVNFPNGFYGVTREIDYLDKALFKIDDEFVWHYLRMRVTGKR